MVDRKREPYPPRRRVGREEFDDAETTEFRFAEPDLEIPELTDQAYPSGFPDEHHPADEIFPAGLLLGKRYEILELMHTGGMGHLYKARDARLPAGDSDSALVAVKVLRRRLHDRPDTRHLLELEAARARHLSHPNIINVYDFDEHDGQFFLVMEWLDGRSVQDLLQATRGRRLDGMFAWRVIDGIAKALQHAHDNGIVHADVNPSNVFICDTQEIKLLDFGVARDSGDDEDEDAKSIWVTPSYSSPDVLAGNAPVVADDIFSLACVAYRLLAGKQAFDGMTPAEAKAKGVLPAPIPGIAPDDWRLLERALAFDPSERPASVVEFRRDAAPAMTQPVPVPVPAAPAEPARPASVAGPAAAADGASRSPLPLPPTWQLAGAAGIVAVALLIWAIWPGSGTEQSSAVRPAPNRVADRPPASAESSLDGAAESSVATADGGQAVTAESEGTASAAGDDQTAAAPVEETAGIEEAPVAAPVATDPPAPASGASVSAGSSASTRSPAATATADARPTPTGQAAGSEPIAAGAAASSASSGPAAAAAQPAATALEDSPPEAPSAVAADDDGGQVSEPETAETPAPQALAAADTEVAAGSEAPSADDTVAAAPSDAEEDGNVGAAALAASAAALTTAVPDSVPDVTGDDGADATPAAADDAPPADEPAAAAEETLMTAASADGPAMAGTGADTAAALPQSGNKVDVPPAKEEVVPLSELNLERYVPPRFPRTARYREQSGYVDVRFSVLPDGSTGDIVSVASTPGDVFVESAEEAVARWRFASRDEAVTAQVRLSFDVEE